MKLSLSQKDRNDLHRLIDTLNSNIAIAEFYQDLIENAKTLSRYIKDHPVSSIFDNIQTYFSLNKVESFNKLASSHQVSNIERLLIKDYENDPFYRTVKPNKCCLNQWKLTYRRYEPYELFVCNDTSTVNNSFLEKTSLGYFDRPFTYLAVEEGEKIWMSVTPNEINTMKNPIAKAHGRVLTYGLGLGYFPFMCSLKDDVISVTVIEKDPQLVSLYKKSVEPYFAHKEKINIINDDALAYATKRLKYDYVFADIWHTVDDGLEPYFRLKRLERSDVEYCYWIEDSLLAMVRRAFLIFLHEAELGIDEIKEVDQKEPFWSRMVTTFHSYFSNIKINSFADVMGLLKTDSLVRLMNAVDL